MGQGVLGESSTHEVAYDRHFERRPCEYRSYRHCRIEQTAIVDGRLISQTLAVQVNAVCSSPTSASSYLPT